MAEAELVCSMESPQTADPELDNGGNSNGEENGDQDGEVGVDGNLSTNYDSCDGAIPVHRCERCENYETLSHGALITHMSQCQGTADGDHRHHRKMFECDVCNMKFSNGANMRRHKMRHTGVKPYECRVCQKRFFRKDHLAEHFTTHTKTLPYHCPICNRGFQRQIAMRAHFQNEHVGQHDMIKSCPLCSYRAGSMKSLRVHFFNRHGIDLDNPGPPPNTNNGATESSVSAGGCSDSGDSTGARSADNATPPMHFLTPHVEISMTDTPASAPFSPTQAREQTTPGCLSVIGEPTVRMNGSAEGSTAGECPGSPQSADSNSNAPTSSIRTEQEVTPSVSLIPIKQELDEEKRTNASEPVRLLSATSNSFGSTLIKVSPLKSLLRDDLKRRGTAITMGRARPEGAVTSTPTSSGGDVNGSSPHSNIWRLGRNASLQCIFCGIGFPDQTLYFLHKGCHSDSNPWKCNICGEQCCNVYDFNSHLLSKTHQEEWQDTYQNAYSTDLELQEKAYTQMRIWKARFPNLPLGVECTMSTLHVKLCDRERDNSAYSGTYKDRDLQLLYSTAVMRFLNQLTVLSDRKDSMYKVAQQHQLPDWIINLRHEAAHGNSMPALYLLRQATSVIFQWLKEHYWEAEAEIMEDVVRNPEEEKGKICSEISRLLELWVKLKIHYWSKLKTIDKIDDEDVRKQAMDLAGEEGFGIKIRRESGNISISEKTEIKDNSGSQIEGEVEQSYEYTHKIKTAFEPLLRRLFGPLKSKTYKKMLYQKCLIDCLIGCLSFCPAIEVEKLSEPEVLELMSLLGELWKEVVEGLQAQELLHCLVKQLMLQENQLFSGQLWLRLITQLIATHPPPLPPGTPRVSQILAGCLPCHVNPDMLVQRVNSRHLKNQRPIDLKPPSAKEIEVLQELVKSVVKSPTNFSTQYLHSLLSLWEPRLSWEAREKLCTLARIYNGQKPLRNPPSQVFTVASLKDHGEADMQVEDNAEELRPTENERNHYSPWTLYSGDADWSHCALGALPW